MTTANEVIILFIFSVIVYSIPLLYGTVGEIMVEKSGSLNLGVEGTMAIGAVIGYVIGCRADSFIIALLVAFIAAALVGALFAFLTVTGPMPGISTLYRLECTFSPESPPPLSPEPPPPPVSPPPEPPSLLPEPP